MSAPEQNPYLLRPSLVAVLALIAGQAFALGIGIATWHPAAILASLALMLPALVPRNNLATAIGIAGVCLSVGLWQQSRLNASDEAAFRTIEIVADGGSALSAVSGRLATFPRRTTAGW